MPETYTTDDLLFIECSYMVFEAESVPSRAVVLQDVPSRNLLQSPEIFSVITIGGRV